MWRYSEPSNGLLLTSRISGECRNTLGFWKRPPAPSQNKKDSQVSRNRWLCIFTVLLLPQKDCTIGVLDCWCWKQHTCGQKEGNLYAHSTQKEPSYCQGGYKRSQLWVCQCQPPGFGLRLSSEKQLSASAS